MSSQEESILVGFTKGFYSTHFSMSTIKQNHVIRRKKVVSDGAPTVTVRGMPISSFTREGTCSKGGLEGSQV